MSIFTPVAYSRKYCLLHPWTVIAHKFRDVHCAWQRANKGYCYNTDDNLLFGRTDVVLNQVKNEDLLARLEEIKSDPHISGFMELMIHEQYFYETYKYYKPNFTDVVLNSAKWAYENGYKPVFMEELLKKTSDCSQKVLSS